MTIFYVETYTVKPDKLVENIERYKKWETWWKNHPEVCKEIKSNKLFSHMVGGNYGEYVEMTEFENLTDLERFYSKFMKSDFMATIYPEFLSHLVPGKYSTNIWSSVP